MDQTPKKIKIVEVGLRDGLQNEQILLKTNRKLDLINKLSNTGLTHLEITAFVNPKWIPALYDHEKILQTYKKNKDIVYQVLVPNLIGYEKLKKYEFDEFSIVLSASNTHNIKNTNQSINEALKSYKKLAQQARSDKKPFRTYISCAFGCPYEGKINSKIIIDISKKMLDMGASELSISDTIGIANPQQTKDLVCELKEHIPIDKIALHMHDTRNMALTNIFTAIQHGVSTFDSSFGGLGGCPYAYGAAGNVSTEDLVSMLYSMNIETSVNIDKLCEVSLSVQKMLNKKLPSKILAIYNK
jgi:hydroxymethylglutaryl-CoA lyase